MVNEDELPLNERKAIFGVVYLRAVAAVAGYGAGVPESDYDSVDLIVSSKEGKRHRLEFQVKCTAAELPQGDDFPFRLEKKNYDELRIDTITPRLLLVVLVPDEPEAWLRQSERRMNLRRSGYWLSLRGLDESPGQSSITVRVPRVNLLTPSALRALMVGGIPT